LFAKWIEETFFLTTVNAAIRYDAPVDYRTTRGLVANTYNQMRNEFQLARKLQIADTFSRLLQVQEQLTNESPDAILDAIGPEGVMVVPEGKHNCAALQVVKKHSVNMTIKAQRGEFRTFRDLRDDVYHLTGK
jgi:GTP cyclohydrolase I